MPAPITDEAAGPAAVPCGPPLPWDCSILQAVSDAPSGRTASPAREEPEAAILPPFVMVDADTRASGPRAVIDAADWLTALTVLVVALVLAWLVRRPG